MEKINLDYLTELGGGDNEFVVDMLQTYVDETGKDMLELEKSKNEGNLKRIGFLAHRCKAAFQMLGLKQLVQDAEALEQGVKVETAVISDFEQLVNKVNQCIEVSIEEAKILISEKSN